MTQLHFDAIWNAIHPQLRRQKIPWDRDWILTDVGLDYWMKATSFPG